MGGKLQVERRFRTLERAASRAQCAATSRSRLASVGPVSHRGFCEADRVSSNDEDAGYGSGGPFSRGVYAKRAERLRMMETPAMGRVIRRRGQALWGGLLVV